MGIANSDYKLIDTSGSVYKTLHTARMTISYTYERKLTLAEWFDVYNSRKNFFRHEHAWTHGLEQSGHETLAEWWMRIYGDK